MPPASVSPASSSACLVAALGLSFGEHAFGAIASITDCTDAALRSAVAAAGTGDTIDLSGLTCSSLTLSAGAVPIAVFDLTLQGPTDRVLTINADPVNHGRVFDHGGHGTVEIDNLTLANGYVPSVAGSYGGCVFTAGSVRLIHSAVTGCQADFGGGAYAVSGIEVHYSSISSNLARVTGGGLLVPMGNGVGFVHAYSSTIEGNHGPACGGVEAFNVRIVDSVVSGNNVMLNAGGVCGYAVTITNSTISGNSAMRGIGGINCYTLTLDNSTVAFNRTTSPVEKAPGGIYVHYTATITSSIIARNAALGSVADLYGADLANVSAGYSLIVSSNKLTLSLTSDPQLTPLAYHGGPTRTHALQATSPAMNSVSNMHGLSTDQRGMGFDRVVGSKADIGAYERQPNDDEIFYGGFD